VLANWCEAGGTPAAFWLETPRTVFAMIRGYRRRRGWMVWHQTVLPRVEQIPALHVLMDEDEPPRDPAEEAERRLENLRAWQAALDAQARMAAPPEPEEPDE
jgi:hypothetical protein